jgi:hypothetical protein
VLRPARNRSYDELALKSFDGRGPSSRSLKESLEGCFEETGCQYIYM